ncbi:outer membrane protein [Helicobacter baculiformis]|uniref:Outer membrane protein n=1 Tax=Helicobacter baculiformis TaxID=427351 RepID=A0ABV7ZIQ4_9HELI|nr:outer membrane protein [Helicobacter baculiformis]
MVSNGRRYRHVLGFSIATLFSLASLHAEENGVFLGGGFQYSNASAVNTMISVDSSPISNTYTYNGNLFGADIQAGYKQFFGKTKRFGLRYYGFFSGQGGSTSAINSTFEFAQTKPTSLIDYGYAVINQPTANLFYGVGVDFLYNFHESQQRTFGLFLGAMLGGSSWLMGKATMGNFCPWTNNDGICRSMNGYFAQWAKDLKDPSFYAYGNTKATFMPTFVQLILNFCLRANFTKHQGFEAGVRVPTIDDPYFSATNVAGKKDHYALVGKGGSKETFTFRRNVAIFANYVFNF